MLLLGPALIILICVGIYLYLHLSNSYLYWEKRNVSFEKPKLCFGNLLDIALGNVTLGKYIAQLYQKFKTPYFGIFMLDKPVLVIKDPNILRNIFVKDFQHFTDKNFFTDVKIDPLFSRSIITAPHKRWKLLRSQLTSIFTSGKLKIMMELEKERANKLVHYLKARVGEDFNGSLIENFVTESIIACFYGIDSNCFEEDNPIKHHSFQLFPKSGFDSVKIYSYNFLHSAVKLFRIKFLNDVSGKFLQDLFRGVIRNRKLKTEKRYDLIDLLLNLKDEDNCEIDEEVLVSQAVTLLVAGQDTTNLILLFTLYELSKKVEIQDRLRNEICDVLHKQDGVTYEVINKMKYLDMVISETLRKYPVVNFLQRKCIKDYTVPETGLKIERNTNIMIPIHGLHFDPKYFHNPEKFDPDRFAESNKNVIDSYVYLPFGVGPRNCIGKRFALLTIKVALVYMLKHFKFKERAENPNEVEFKTSHIGHPTKDFKLICELIN